MTESVARNSEACGNPAGRFYDLPDREKGFRPGKLWSLWDMIHAFQFSDYRDVWLGMASVFQSARQHAKSNSSIPAQERISHLSHLNRGLAYCQGVMPLRSAVAFRKAIACLEQDPDNSEEFYRLVSYAINSLHDEMSEFRFLQIDRAVQHYLDPASELIEPKVAEKFPNAVFDLEEGLRCFALARYTACVFHTMRAMETIALVMANALGAQTTEGSGKTMAFGKLVNSIGDKIKAMPESDPMRDDWSSAQTLLLHVNRGYRVPVAHPGTKYTGEEAGRITSAVRSFAPALADLL